MEKEQIQVSIFDFTDYKAYLIKKGLPFGFYAHRSRNLGSWAKRLGYKSPSSLSMILTGERIPSEEMIDKIAEDFSMSARERQYFKLLVNLEKARKRNQETSELLKLIQKMANEREGTLEENQNHMSTQEWYVYVIRELLSKQDFIEDENWISSRLRRQVNPMQIRQALHLLEVRGHLVRDEKGELVMNEQNPLPEHFLGVDGASKHHYSTLEMAMHALAEHEFNDPHFCASTLSFKRDDLQEAKKYISDFVQGFSERFRSQDGDEVFQLNAQFFGLTKSEHSENN